MVHYNYISGDADKLQAAQFWGKFVIVDIICLFYFQVKIPAK